MKKLCITFVAALAALALSLPVADAGGRPLTAAMSGDNEVPQPVATGASGTASVTLNQGQGRVCFDLGIDFDDLSGPPWGAHIHSGELGANGPVVVNLQIAVNGPSGCVDGIDKETIKAIRQNPDRYYINVHTDLNPGGEVRGQLSK